MFQEHRSDFFGKSITHGHTTPVDTDTIENGIRSCEVNIFEDIRGECGRGRNLAA